MMRKPLSMAALSLAILAPCAPALEVAVKLAPTGIEKLPYVQPLLAPEATCPGVGESGGGVAMGKGAGKKPQTSLFSLAAPGKPPGPRALRKLPGPASLAARQAYPLSLAFHPTLP